MGRNDDFWSTAADALASAPQFARPGDLAKALYHGTVDTPALTKIDESLVGVAEGRIKRLLVCMPPQEGKSERISHYFPLWMLLRDPDLRIVIASYDLETARRWGRVIRQDVETFQGQEGLLDLGIRPRRGNKAAGNWSIEGARGGIFCAGTGGALTGRPADLVIIDDPVKGRTQTESERLQQIAWDWWTGTVTTRLAPGAPVVMVLTRWHEADLAGQLLEQAELDKTVDQWEQIVIPAQCDNPATDVLGRAEGEYMISAREGREFEWEKIKRRVGSRDWAALYQQRPAPAEGNILRREWWQRYDIPRAFEASPGSGIMKCHSQGRMIQSWDMSFKDTDGSDYVVGQVWLKQGADMYLLDMVRRRMDFTATVEAVCAMTYKWPQSSLKLIEDKANGPAVISKLRKEIPGIVPYTPRDSKQARAYAVAPFCEARNVWLPSARCAEHLGFDVEDFVDEAAAFPNAAHDDMVDAFTQAATRLLLEGSGVYTFMDSLLRERGVTLLNDHRPQEEDERGTA